MVQTMLECMQAVREHASGSSERDMLERIMRRTVMGGRAVMCGFGDRGRRRLQHIK